MVVRVMRVGVIWLRGLIMGISYIVRWRNWLDAVDSVTDVDR